MSLSIAEIYSSRIDESNPFDSPLYRECWLAHLAEKYRVIRTHEDFALHAKRTAKGLITLRELKPVASHTAWSQDLTSERVETLLSLPPKMDWDYFYMVWSGSRREQQAIELLEKAGYPILDGWAKPMHVADISGGFENYLTRQNSNNRYQIKKKLKLAQKGRPEFVRFEREDEIAPFFEQFFEAHITYWQAKIGYSYFSDPAERAFTLAWARILHQQGKLRLRGLKLNDRLCNLTMGFVHGNTFYWQLTINTGDQLDLFPGIAGLYMGMEEAGREGLEVFNMGYGSLPYKIQAQTHTDSRNVLVVINPQSFKGRLYGAWFRYKNR